MPRFLGFLIVLFVGYLVAKAISKALNAILERVGFDKAVERGGVKKALAQSKYDASDVLAKVVYYAIMLFVLSTAFGVFGQNPISDYLHAVATPEGLKLREHVEELVERPPMVEILAGSRE